jgi:hypothetical protein
MADTNAKVGSVASAFVGEHQADVENAAGAALHQFAADLELCIPSTFHAEGEGWTWQNEVAGRHRIDFVLVPVAWLPAVVKAWVSEDVCLAIEDRMDHRMAVIELSVGVGPQPAPQAQWASGDFMRHINRRALNLPASAEALQ